MRSRVTRLWLKKLARKKRARSRKMKEVKLTKEWEVIETAAIAKFVDKRYEKAVDRIKEDCGYIRHVHRNKVNVENNTMSLLKTKLKDLKAKARIFENLVRCRSGFCNIRMEESSQEKKRHGRKRKRKGSSKCRNKIKRLLVIRNGWDRYLSESELGFKP